MNNKTIVTTSWDDGHVLDMKLADLLEKYSIAGTLYVCPKDREFSPEDLLSDAQIVDLSQRFEIGAHTLTHPMLYSDLAIGTYRMVKTWFQSHRANQYHIAPRISLDAAAEEVVGSKVYLEHLISESVTSFCYPDGRFDKEIEEIVREAGFTYARTTNRFCFSHDHNRFSQDTSLHTFNHTLDLWRIAQFSQWNWSVFKANCRWEYLAKSMFDYVHENGGIFHLWGHSWELQANDDWETLERVFAYIGGKDDVAYLENRELAAHAQ